MTAWPFWLALALGGLGVYFRLIAARPTSNPALGRAGTVLGAASLVLLMALAWTTSETWPAPARMASGPRIGVLVLLAGILLSSGAAVTCSRSAVAGFWFALALAANSALWLCLGSLWAGLLALAIVCCVLGLTVWWLAWTVPWELTPMQNDSDAPSEHEPWLACVAAVLLAGSLAGAMHDSFVTEHSRAAIEPASRPTRAGERMHHLLIAGALMAALGGVGFSSRGGDHRLAVAGAITLQGIVLTCVAWTASHSRTDGQALSVAALLVVVLQTSTVVILLRRGDSQVIEESPSASPVGRTWGLHGCG